MATKRPQNDAEARAKCIGCRHRETKEQCEVVGLITVATRHECLLGGYADWSNKTTWGSMGKVEPAPPCE